MLMTRDKSCLLLIDVQEKLTPFVLDNNHLINNCQWLLQLAKDMEVPIIVSEQYPSGLGSTIPALKNVTSHLKPIEKVAFSSFRAKDFDHYLKKENKNQLILIGIETHVCVLQTALDLKKAGFDVFVVVNAVSSRYPLDKKYALKRMAQNGITLVTAEMVLFEWLGQAGTEEFKKISKKYLLSSDKILHKDIT